MISRFDENGRAVEESGGARVCRVDVGAHCRSSGMEELNE